MSQFSLGDTMWLRKTIAPISSLFLLGLLAGCGSSSNSAVAPPTGGFTNSSLSGTYVFSTSGVDASSGEYLTLVGAFTANNGGISGGNVDILDLASAVVDSNQPITGGSYSVGVDGRGQIQLKTSALGSTTLDFVLTSSSHGLVTEFDSFGTGSGTLDLQSSPSVSGSYVFSIAGVGSGGTVFSTAGAFTVGAGGSVTSGVEDFAGTADINLPIYTSSSVALGTGTAPGTATLATSAGTFSFDVYAIDSTHMKFVESDGAAFTTGDVFQQTSAQAATLPTGTLAFTMTGLDIGEGPLALGGLLPTDSNGTITGGIEDYNDDGFVPTSSVTGVSGSFSPLIGGRSELTLTNFENGATNDLLQTYSFAAYPSSGGILLLEIDGVDVTGGSAFVQTSTSLAASQGYGLNLSAFNISNDYEEDDIAEFTTTSSGFTGLIDLNDDGTLSHAKNLYGNYSVSGGRGTATFAQGTSSSAGVYFDVVFYPVDGTNFLCLETDSTQLGTGTFQLQNASGSSSSAVLHPMFTRAMPVGHFRRKR